MSFYVGIQVIFYVKGETPLRHCQMLEREREIDLPYQPQSHKELSNVLEQQLHSLPDVTENYIETKRMRNKERAIKRDKVDGERTQFFPLLSHTEERPGSLMDPCQHQTLQHLQSSTVKDNSPDSIKSLSVSLACFPSQIVLGQFRTVHKLT